MKDTYKLNLTIDGEKKIVEVSVKELRELIEAAKNYSESMSYDERLREATRIAIEKGKGFISTSLLQRQLHIGYGCAAAIISDLVEMGVVGENERGKRAVLISSIDEYPREIDIE